jgi:hypothetical protein
VHPVSKSRVSPFGQDITLWPTSLFILVLLCLHLAACATPQGVKDASKKQLQLLGAMNKAAIGLKQGLDDFHTQQENTIEDWARVATAAAAIDSLTKNEEGKEIAADALFEEDENDIRPLIDAAATDFKGQANSLEALRDQKQSEGDRVTDPEIRKKLQVVAANLGAMRNNARRREAAFSSAAQRSGCQECSLVRGQALALIDDERTTAAYVDLHIEILEEQIAVMSQVASAVDQWLAIDVTLSQQQADQLDKTYKDAIAALEKSK